eukprot:SAG11_NODE_4729_length_1789_cov_1.577515_2_plen_172_part_00
MRVPLSAALSTAFPCAHCTAWGLRSQYNEHYRDQSEKWGVLSSVGGAALRAGARVRPCRACTHVPYTRASRPLAGPNPKWDSPAMATGSWGAQIVGELAPREGEPVVRGKHGLDSFARPSQLDAVLRRHGVSNVAIGDGCQRNLCTHLSLLRMHSSRAAGLLTLLPVQPAC